MEDVLNALLGHDPLNRGIDREKFERSGLRGTADVSDVLHLAHQILARISSCTSSILAKELAELFSYRIMFLLLPEECLFSDPVRDKPVITRHLESIGVSADPDLVSAIKFFVDNFRTKTRKQQNKVSITDVFVKFRVIYDEILSRQNKRCAVCGVELLYGRNMQLDHVLPWHLGDDPADGSNWQFLCEPCNRGKGMLPHYSLSLLQSNWIKPNSSAGLSEDVRYAVLKRDGKCWRTGVLPTQAELTVEKCFQSGCWVLDNLRSVAK